MNAPQPIETKENGSLMPPVVEFNPHASPDDIELYILNNHDLYSPQQAQVMLDLVTSIKVLDEQLKNIDPSKVNLASYKNELENLRAELDTIGSQKPAEFESLNSVVPKEEVIKGKSATYETLSKLKTTAFKLEHDDQSQPVNREVLKKQLRDHLRELIDHAALPNEEKAALNKAADSDIEKISKPDPEKKLNIFQKVVVWFNVKVQKKENRYNWLTNYLQKNVFKDETSSSKETKKYIQQNYQDIYKEAESRGELRDEKAEKQEKVEPLKCPEEPVKKAQENSPAQTGIKKETDKAPESAQANENEAQPDKKAEKLEYYERLKKSKVESVLQAVEKEKSGEASNFETAREKVNNYLNEIIAEDNRMAPLDKVRLVTRELEQRILHDNMQNIPGNIDVFYSSILERGTGNSEQDFALKEAVRINKGVVENLIRQRKVQCQNLSDLIESGHAHAAKELKLDADNNKVEYDKAVENYVAGRLTEQIADNLLRNNLISDVEGYKKQIQGFLASGALSVQFATDRSGGGYPIFIANEYIDSNGEKFSGKQILNLLTGGRPNTEESKLAAGYQFTITDPATTAEGKLERNALQIISVAVDDSNYNPDDIIQHEYIHAVNAAKKEAYLVGLRDRIESVTFNSGAGKRFLNDLAVNSGQNEESVREAISRYVFSEGTPDANLPQFITGAINTIQGRIANTENPLSENDKKQSEQLIAQLNNYTEVIKKRRETYNNRVQEGWGRPLDEVAAKSADATEMVTLEDIDINRFNINDEVHRSSLGLLRLVNQYVALGQETTDPAKKNTLRERQAFMGRYFGTWLGTDEDEVSASEVIAKFLEAVNASEPDNMSADLKMLRTIAFEDLHLIPAEINTDGLPDKLINTYIDYLQNNQINVTPETHDSFSSQIRLLISSSDPKAREEAVRNISALFPGIKLPYLKDINAQSTYLINLFLSAPNETEGGNFIMDEEDPDPANKFRHRIHPFAPIRHSVRYAGNAYLYGERKKGTYMGEDKMGGKVDVNFRLNHPKDMGPQILRFGGLNRKVLVDGFGFGTDQFRPDSCDGFEGLYFLTGISWHKFPWLQNLPEYWKKLNLPGPLKELDKDPFVPRSILAPSVDAYTNHVINDIFGRLSMERFYDAQALVRLVVEFGGFEYDAQGSPRGDRRTYATKLDTYRLNNSFAGFIGREKIVDDDGDRQSIVNRMLTDKIYDANGNQINVIQENGHIVNADTHEVIQKNGLYIGQISQNIIDEIGEIMVHGDSNIGLQAPAWKLGREMKEYNGRIKSLLKTQKKWEAFQKLGKKMMIEDAKSRATGGRGYTITDLILEIERAQNEPMGDLRNPDGSVNQSMVDRFTDQKIHIGTDEDAISVADAKEFLKEFTLARSQKVTSIGVWERGPQIKRDANNNKVAAMGHLDAEKFIQQANAAASQGQARFIPIPGNESGQFIEMGGKNYYFSVDDRNRMSVVEVENTNWDYSRDAKLSFIFRQTGFSFSLDPIQGLPKEILKRYYGRPKEYFIHDPATNRDIRVYGRENYSTEEGQMFDDVYDTLTKIQMGKELSYKFSMKLYFIDKYRDQSKMLKEYYEGLLQIETFARKAILVMTAVGLFVPPLAFLAQPALILGALGWSLLGQPFISRAAKGWQARMMASLEAQDAALGASGAFFELADENKPPSFGELDLMNTRLESVKAKYRSVLKNFNEGAKWNTNIVTDLFSTAWKKVAIEPPIKL